MRELNLFQRQHSAYTFSLEGSRIKAELRAGNAIPVGSLRTHSPAFSLSSAPMLSTSLYELSILYQVPVCENQPVFPGHEMMAPEQAQEKAPSWNGFAVDGGELNISSS